MKVLLASDGSPHAMEAARFLSELAGKERFDVSIFSVTYDPSHSRSSTGEPWYPEWKESEMQRVRAHQEAIQNLLHPVCTSTNIRQKLGAPVPCILEEAKRIDADLIVVGAKGHTALHRIVLGSTSDSVATHAECSVLVVRSKQLIHPNDELNAPSVISKPPKVLFAYDGSQRSREAINEQLSLNWDPKTEVNVVSVATQPIAFFDETYAAMAVAYETEQVEQLRCDAERLTADISKQVRNVNLQVPRANHVGDAIVTAAEQNHDDLVVVGDTGHSVIGDWLLGSTTKYVLRHAPCSVWISRHHRRD